ncbi:ExbD/TolR family protein [Oceaniglobus trochenteri]|uniref:ExbD/TolR family protein n=1 Tax=Oceaniglobus trochenteri TaxID=2763260 RepID=UPI001CFF6D3C|nr:biopolymer transporter ExbD [Oceaniglobus trochenteri]
MRISRPTGPRAAISLVAMIDVLMILLVFFMVTSTYLDLDMVPLAGAEAPGGGAGGDAPVERVLVRLSADGGAFLRGQPLDPEVLRRELEREPALDILVLPSGQASVQALAGLMDVLVGAGAQRLRIVRLEAQP